MRIYYVYIIIIDVANSDTIYGRFVPNGIGTLTVNGVAK